MATIRIHDQTYTLPVISTTQFQSLQAEIRRQQQAIQDGVRQPPRWLGVVPRAPVAMSIEERYEALEHLIRNYHAIIAELRHSKTAYEHFFTQLAYGVQEALQHKTEELRTLEQERQTDFEKAVAEGDETSQRLAEEDEGQLLEVSRLLGQATLLLLKKLALCQESLNKLVEDQSLQAEVLAQLTGHLENQRRAYERRKRIQQVKREVAEMAKVALEFESYMRDHLGPMQKLIEQVVQVDHDLHSAASEIETLTHQMLHEGAWVAPQSDALDQNLLSFLTASKLKKERLVALWEHLGRQDTADSARLDAELDIALATEAGASGSVADALDNIRTLAEISIDGMTAFSDAADGGPATIGSLPAKVRSLKFYEHDKNFLSKHQRVYRRRFLQHASRYIYWELEIEHARHGQRVDFHIEVVYFHSDGRILGRDWIPACIGPDCTSSTYYGGWGSDYGNWQPDFYLVELTINGTDVISGAFEMAPPPSRTSSP